MDNLTQQVNQMRVADGVPRGGRGGRGRGAPRGSDGRNGTSGRRESQSMSVPKEDYDFESANAKFSLTKQDLVKEAIASGSPVGSPANGTTTDPMATAGATALNGPTTEAADVVIPKKESEGYNKKSSFFDNISSDLKDRVEAAEAQERFDGRAMRREERAKNMDTFGQGSVDGGFRGGYRGRGGFRGGQRGRGGYGRGRGGGAGYDGAAAVRGGGYRGRGRGGGEIGPLA